jgi:hypothetical protein
MKAINELIGKKVKIQKDFEFLRILAALKNLNVHRINFG